MNLACLVKGHTSACREQACIHKKTGVHCKLCGEVLTIDEICAIIFKPYGLSGM